VRLSEKKKKEKEKKKRKGGWRGHTVELFFLEDGYKATFISRLWISCFKS
jgi:hypothetical protein